MRRETSVEMDLPSQSNIHPEKSSREPFTAKPPRAQRTYSKKKNHPFGEAENRSKPWISWRLCDLAVEVCILTAFFRIILLFVWPRHEQMARVAKNQIPGRVRETKKIKYESGTF